MSRFLKRPMKKGEVVHHIDGNKENNEIWNLKLCQSQGKHRTEHKINKKDRFCSECGGKTNVDENKYEQWYSDGKGGYLCRKCYTKKNYNYVKKQDR